MIVKSPERMYQDEQGIWWYRWPDHGTKPGIRGKCSSYTCERCGTEFIGYPSHGKARFCSKSCGAKSAQHNRQTPAQGKGSQHYQWKGGRFLNKAGYVMVWMPDHPDLVGTKRKYVLEHRLVMEQHLGRCLAKDERVHHKDGNRQNNDLANLELWRIGHPSGQRVEEQAVSIPLGLLLELLRGYCPAAFTQTVA